MIRRRMAAGVAALCSAALLATPVASSPAGAATAGAESYLVDGVLPRAGAVCHSDYRPFSAPAATTASADRRSAATAPAQDDRRTALENALRSAVPSGSSARG